MNNEIELFPHNEIGYKKLVTFLKNSNYASLNHATGTGKSFIILKYLYENRNKRILYLAPTYPIIDQLVNEHTKELGISIKDFKKFDSNIYSNLMKMDVKEIFDNYDIIILDEYHRCGAKKWGLKVKELMDLIKSSNTDKKVIGTTATEIRYLDNNRNMNDILFDGKTASKLSLADAILQGILPVFEYVLSYYALITNLEKLETRVERSIPYDDLKKEYREKIYELKKYINQKIVDETDLFDYIPKKGKFLVFSSTIEGFENDRETIKSILENENYNEFFVSYKNGKNLNNNIISEFRKKSNDEKSILYSVNLLNEGFHLRDINAIFMFRETTSPIIYFQQLGRLLSFSKDKKRVVVFDFKNNIKNNEVIYNLYEEVLLRAKELLITDPDNRERYEYIINNFKIVEPDKNIYKLSEEMQEKLSRKNISESRLEYAIKILEKNDINEKFNNVQALIDLFHYENLITLDQFKRVKKLNIEKPPIFKYSELEFEHLLKGYKNIKERISNLRSDIFDAVISYIDKNGVLPSINSNDDYELILGYRLFQNFMYFSSDEKNKILSCPMDNLSYIEKITYDIKNFDNNYTLLYEGVQYLIDKNLFISDDIVTLLKKINTNESENLIEKIYDSSGKSSLIEEDELLKAEKSSKNKFGVNIELLFRQKVSNILKKIEKEYNNSIDKEQYIKNIFDEIYSYVEQNYSLPKYSDENMELIVKRFAFYPEFVKYGYEEKLEKLLKQIESNKELAIKDISFRKVLDYVEEHDGYLPLETDNKNYKYLKNFIKYQELLNDRDKRIIDLIKLKYKIKYIKIVREYCSFIKRKRRRPNINFGDYEKGLVERLDSIRFFLDAEENELLNSTLSQINKYKEVEEVYSEILNKRRKF